jgi:hypothetical protein
MWTTFSTTNSPMSSSPHSHDHSPSCRCTHATLSPNLGSRILPQFRPWLHQ